MFVLWEQQTITVFRILLNIFIKPLQKYKNNITNHSTMWDGYYIWNITINKLWKTIRNKLAQTKYYKYSAKYSNKKLSKIIKIKQIYYLQSRENKLKNK